MSEKHDALDAVRTKSRDEDIVRMICEARREPCTKGGRGRSKETKTNRQQRGQRETWDMKLTGMMRLS